MMRKIGRVHEVDEKLERVRGFLDRFELDGALFTAQNVVSWVTGGIEDRVERGTDPGLAWALVTREAAYLLASNIEGPRIENEEGPAEIGFDVSTFPWEEDRLDNLVEELCDPARLANDGAGPGRSMPMELQKLRLELTPEERDRIRDLGADAHEALEEAVRTVRRGTREAELAGEIAMRLERRRIFPHVMLVGADERHIRFRHPTVDSKPIEQTALAVIVGVRRGLNIALTRTVSLGPLENDLASRHRAACEVEARLISATRPGATYGDVLQTGVETYESLGYPEEWRHHYQGGPIGYGPREFDVAPSSKPNAFTSYRVAEHHACAWNPTVQGTKSEDTFLVGQEGPEIITSSDTWPTLDIPLTEGILRRPAILELG